MEYAESRPGKHLVSRIPGETLHGNRELGTRGLVCCAQSSRAVGGWQESLAAASAEKLERRRGARSRHTPQATLGRLCAPGILQRCAPARGGKHAPFLYFRSWTRAALL